MFSAEKIKNWIFVTGLIRSGTTFVGTILSHPISVDYIHEPFNPQCGIQGMELKHRYLRSALDTVEMKKYDLLVKPIFSYNIKFKNYVPTKDLWFRRIGKQILGSRGKFYLRLAKINPLHKASVIKDPTGCFLAEYLYSNFNVKPVLLTKHPTSFIASLKRVDWWPSLSSMNDQPELVEDFFSEDKDFIYQDFSDPVRSAAAYWRAINKVFLSQINKYPNWHLITHEKLSEEPVLTFKNLYKDLNLPWSQSVYQKIIESTHGKSTQARRGLVQDFNRNSADIFKARRESLTLEERKAIFEMTEDVALQIYSRESFDID